MTPFPGRRVSAPHPVPGQSWAPAPAGSCAQWVFGVQVQPILGPRPALGRVELGSAALPSRAVLSIVGRWAMLVSGHS